jgi:lipid-A-disaccharide synthase
MAVPELLQHNATPAALADAVTPLLTDKAAAARQIAELNEVARALGEGSETPSLRAAHAILDFVRARRSHSPR